MAHARATVFECDGKGIPAALERLPAGRYVVEQIAPRRELTRDEEEGLFVALDSIREGRTLPASVVHARLRAMVKRASPSARKRRVKAR